MVPGCRVSVSGGHAGGEVVASHGGGRTHHCVRPGCTSKSLGGSQACDCI